MFCFKCGKANEDGSTFCQYCGQRLNTFNTPNPIFLENKPSPLSTWLRVISIILMVVFAAVYMIDVPNLFVLAFFFLGAVMFAVSSFIKSKNRRLFPKDEIAKQISDILSNENEHKVNVVAKKTLSKRIILTACFSAVWLLFLCMFYYSHDVFFISAILILIYISLFLKFNTFNTLYKYAKNAPGISIADLVLEQTYQETETPKILKTTIACVAIVFVFLGGFIGLNLDSNYDVEQTAGGVEIVAYNPGILNLTDDVVIPQTIDGKTVVSISSFAFSNITYLKSITIPDTVKAIGNDAFYDCRLLSKVTLSSNIEVIDDCAFQDCFSLESIELPKTLVEIGDEAFMGCKRLEAIIIPEGVTIIPDSAFESCSSLSYVVIPDSVTQIGEYAFYECESLSEIYLPNYDSIIIAENAFEEEYTEIKQKNLI